MSGRKRKSSTITATAKVGDSSSSGSEDDDGVPVIHRFTYTKKLSRLEPIGKSKDIRSDSVNSVVTQQINDDDELYDENEDENSDASKSSSNSSKNSAHVSSSNIRRENHHDDDQNDRNQGKQNGNNDQARMMKLEFLKQSDGSCIVACSPDENLEAYGKLQNANCNRVHVPLSCNEMKIMNWKNVPGLEMYPGVKLYRTSHMENCVIQRLKIEPRTVKPMETLDRHNAVITALKGSVVVKVLSFTLTKSGKPALKGVELQEGKEACIYKGSSYSVENWNDTEVVVMLCLVSKDD